MLEDNQEKLHISVIIPTYNERGNIERLIPQVAEILQNYNYEMVVVDDSSPDGTAEAARELAEKYNVRVLVRQEKSGLSSAVVEGFNASLGDIVGVMDADMQHPPGYIIDFLQAISDGCDIAVGCRYMEGGKTEGWSMFRLLVSRVAIMLTAPLTDVKDPLSGYFFFKRKVIENVSFNPTGFKILLEILVKGFYNNVKEIPYSFKPRKEGQSKLVVSEFASYLKLLYHLYGFKLGKVSQYQQIFMI